MIVLSTISRKFYNEDEKIFKEEHLIEILKVFIWLKIYNYIKNMVEENISPKFRLTNIDKIGKYFVEEIE